MCFTRISYFKNNLCKLATLPREFFILFHKLTFITKWEGIPFSPWQVIIDHFFNVLSKLDLPNCSAGLSLLSIYCGAVRYETGRQLTSQTDVLKRLFISDTDSIREEPPAVRPVTRLWDLVCPWLDPQKHINLIWRKSKKIKKSLQRFLWKWLITLICYRFQTLKWRWLKKFH